MERFIHAFDMGDLKAMDRYAIELFNHPDATGLEKEFVKRSFATIHSRLGHPTKDPPIYKSPHDLPHPSELKLSPPPSELKPSPPPPGKEIPMSPLTPSSSFPTSPTPSEKSGGEKVKKEPIDIETASAGLFDNIQKNFSDDVIRELYQTDEGVSNLSQYEERRYISSSELAGLTNKEIEEQVRYLQEQILPKFSRDKEALPELKPKKDASGNKIPPMHQRYFGVGKSKRELILQYATLNHYLTHAYVLIHPEEAPGKPAEGWGLVPGRHRPIGHRAVGRGLSEETKPVGMSSEGRPPVGISPALKWASFGKYRIDIHKLDNGILALRTSTGSAVGKYPTQKLPSSITPILKSMIEGKPPTFDMLSKMSSEDKSCLKKLTKNAQVFSHVGEGLPSNPDDDEDVREFEIMKGELACGNDNTQLISNFKKQIIKLMHRDLLPKSQGKELLLELVSLGH
jgi:hypothetical protein